MKHAEIDPFRHIVTNKRELYVVYLKWLNIIALTFRYTYELKLFEVLGQISLKALEKLSAEKVVLNDIK